MDIQLTVTSALIYAKHLHSTFPSEDPIQCLRAVQTFQLTLRASGRWALPRRLRAAAAQGHWGEGGLGSTRRVAWVREEGCSEQGCHFWTRQEQARPERAPPQQATALQPRVRGSTDPDSTYGCLAP